MVNGHAVAALEGIDSARVATIERDHGRAELRISWHGAGRLELRAWRLLDGAWWPSEGVDIDADELLPFLRALTDVAERVQKAGGSR